jgi:hypothetical protein
VVRLGHAVQQAVEPTDTTSALWPSPVTAAPAASMRSQ